MHTVGKLLPRSDRAPAIIPAGADDLSALEHAIPHLSANLEDGPKLWKQLEAILTAPHAGAALRAMHALGLLELLLPEFHGIDALVIRDAYHRYTVDEHTFVLIDTLHALLRQTIPASPQPAHRPVRRPAPRPPPPVSPLPRRAAA